MISPGYFSLGDFTITTAGTQTGEWVDGLEGALALLAQIRLAWGSGGTSVKAYLQGSADDGTTAYDIACFTFTTSSAVKLRNFSSLTPKTSDVIPTDGALTDDTSVDGIVPDRVRVKVVSLGTYAGSTLLTCRGVAR